MKTGSNPSDNPEHKLLDLGYILIITYLIASTFFFSTVFFHKKGKMVFPQYIPANEIIGGDAAIYYRFGERYFIDHKSAYFGDLPESKFLNNPFPPLFTLSMAPVFALKLTSADYYKVIFFATILSYIFIGLVFPLLILKKKTLPTSVLFVFITGLLGYGLQFELERGNFNVITLALGLAAVYVYWRYPKVRAISYLLLTISIQFKLYPAILVILLIDNRDTVTKNLKRIFLFGFSNVGLLFIMGWNGFIEFLRSVSTQIDGSGYVRDHGINNFLEWLNKHFLGEMLGTRILLALKIFITLLILGTIILILINAYRNMQLDQLHLPLLFVCLLGMLLLPPASRDYKLPFLCAIMGVMLIYYFDKIKTVRSTMYTSVIVSLFIISLSYSVTSFSWIYKPVVFQNSFPFVFLIFVSIIISEFIAEKNRTDFVLQPNKKYPFSKG